MIEVKKSADYSLRFRVLKKLSKVKVPDGFGEIKDINRAVEI